MKWRIVCCLMLFSIGCGEDTSSDSVIDSIDPQSPRESGMNGPMAPSNRGDHISPEPAPSEAWRPPSGEAVEVEASEGTQVGTQYPEGAEEIVMPRPRRRMNIDQLRTAFEQVSGGISWTERSGRNEVNLFETLSSTLGKPDFAQTTDEELEPTILFQKFLGDAARSVCFKMLDADLNGNAAVESGEPTDWSPTLLVHVPTDETAEVSQEAVTANVQWLVQRFHGRRLPSDAPGLSEWKWLHQTGSFVSGSSHQAWVAVCVGLFTHPDFYMY